ncbi:MAG: hypothetical protein N2053_12510, partial [Chitinispirillaceae bacterium]|nr:hypothetical protein [Chitinispirillaceae bacterium]
DIPLDEISFEEDEIDNDWQNLYLKPAIKEALSRGISIKEMRHMVEDIMITTVISEEKGNLQKASKRLGITDRALQIRRAKGRNYLLKTK